MKNSELIEKLLPLNKEQLFSNVSMKRKRMVVNSLVQYITDKSDLDKAWLIYDLGYKEDDIMIGRCSLEASLEFDVQKFEEKLEEDIIFFLDYIRGKMKMRKK